MLEAIAISLTLGILIGFSIAFWVLWDMKRK